MNTLIKLNNTKQNSYIVHTQFQGLTMFNMPITLLPLTILYNNDHIIFKDAQPLMTDSCMNCYNHLSRNDDDNGLRRGQLTQDIISKLTRSNYERQDDYNNQWEIIWNDNLCLKYKRKDHEDFWLWNHEFYNAPIEDLEYIKSLIKY